MTLYLREISLELDDDENRLSAHVAAYLGLDEDQVSNLKIVRRGIDARKKPKVRRVYTVSFSAPNEQQILQKFAADQRLTTAPDLPEAPVWKVDRTHKALVVGMGPAGLFAAFHLSRRGIDVTLVERGQPVEQRSNAVRQFWTSGTLDPSSNVQFGEGGAGTFSDGKLTTRVNSIWHRIVLETLVECGAPTSILVEAKPHLGTDTLKVVLVNFRQMLLDSGVNIRFETCLDRLLVRDGRVVGGVLGTDEFLSDSLVLAPGHSARDTYEMLARSGVLMEAKPFAIGLRVEHPRELINRIQYGHPNHPRLPTADYALSYNDQETGRGFYSFCMCPGGKVITASSEPGGVVVNGMSSSARMGDFSNSALVVSVRPEDYPGDDALSGVRFQRRWEQAAFTAGGGDYCAPAQNLLDFLGWGQGSLVSTCRPGVREANLKDILPGYVYDVMLRGLPLFERRMKGFVTEEATLIGTETRTSAPLRIVRDKDHGESLSHPGLFPVGEGAGYAGGIMSAAIDGIKAAERIAGRYSCGEYQ